MSGVKDALLRMVKTAMFLKKMAEAYTVLGLDSNPHHQAFGDTMDAIYYLIGEDVEDFSKSVTYTAVTAPFLCDERRAQLLMSEFEKNHPACPDFEPKQPRPNTISRKEIEKMVNKHGGYMSPEGDWQ